jgi:hypothetical protein
MTLQADHVATWFSERIQHSDERVSQLAQTLVFSLDDDEPSHQARGVGTLALRDRRRWTQVR